MPRVVSNIKKHITTTEFWRALSFVLKRLESIAKYLTKLPPPFIFLLYIFHLIRASLRIYHYFNKTKNKNLGESFKLLFAVFKASIALIALVLLGCGFFSLPSVLLASFFAYSILKLIHSSVVLFVSTFSYLKIEKDCIEQQWRRAQYRENITKHTCILSAGLLFVLLTCLLSAGTLILIWSNPLLLLADTVVCILLIASLFYWTYKIAKNKRLANENSFLKTEEIATLKKFLLLFGLSIIALILTAATPSLGVSAIVLALILLCAQDILLTIYYYFYSVSIPDPEPANLEEDQFNVGLLQTNRDYYHTLFPVYYLQTQVSEKFQQAQEVIKTNKKLLLKATFVKLLELESKLERISKLNTISRFFSQQKKLTIKKKCLLHELAWALNTNNKEVLIDLFILAIIDLPESKRDSILENDLSALLELLDFLGMEEYYFMDYRHPQLHKNFLAQLFFMAKQQEFSKHTEFVKPKEFYHSSLKKVAACQALSLAYQASRKIEQDLSLSHPSCRPT